MWSNGEVIIVDEFTGRLMYGRRYSEGLHQAIEAKEGVTVAAESKTLATITFQNYFRLYNKLSGMTGTASPRPPSSARFTACTSSRSSPPTSPMQRMDHPDRCTRPSGKVQRRHRAGRAAPRQGPAGPGGHRLHREREAVAALTKRGIAAQGAERQAP